MESPPYTPASSFSPSPAPPSSYPYGARQRMNRGMGTNMGIPMPMPMQPQQEVTHTNWGGRVQEPSRVNVTPTAETTTTTTTTSVESGTQPPTVAKAAAAAPTAIATPSGDLAWYNRPNVRMAILAVLGLLVIGMLVWLFASTGQSSSVQPGTGTAAPIPASPSPTSPTPPSTSSSSSGKPTVKTPYGLLTGNLLTDTHLILPIGSVVTIYSDYSKGYLRMVNQDDPQAIRDKDVVAAGGAVVQADGKSASDPECQWIVKTPFKYKGAVRLDNAAFDALYLAEAIPTNENNKVVVEPGVGVEWSDFIVTTANFVDSQFSARTDSVVFIGVETAVLNEIEHIVKETHFLMGTTQKGTMINTVNVTTGPSSFWKVNIVGSVDKDGKILYK